jgi:hypothetical protein
MEEWTAEGNTCICNRRVDAAEMQLMHMRTLNTKAITAATARMLPSWQLPQVTLTLFSELQLI